MAMTWCEPRVEIQKFVANDHVAVCVYLYDDYQGHVVRLNQDPTDGKVDVYTDGSVKEIINKGFCDDSWDFLGGVDDEAPIKTGQENAVENQIKGWYSSLDFTGSIVASTGSPTKFEQSNKVYDKQIGFGNQKLDALGYTGNMASTVWYWGTTKQVLNSTLIGSNNSLFKGLGPNASN